MLNDDRIDLINFLKCSHIQNIFIQNEQKIERARETKRKYIWQQKTTFFVVA